MGEPRVILLGGLGRSGTTLVERIVGELPGVVALGEIVHLWHRDIRENERCGCGQRFHDCPFWTEVGARAFGGWDGVDVDRVASLQAAVERTRFIPRLGRSSLPAALRSDVLEYAGYYSKIYQAAAAVAGADVVVDSSKHSSLAFCLRWHPEIDLRVVHVVRDARAVAYSWTKQVARPETDGEEEMTRYSPTRAALLWDVHNAAFGLLRRRGVPVHRLRYEDFLADPVAHTRGIADFVDLPLVDGDLDYLATDHAELGIGHSAAGNPMRFKTGRIVLRRDDEWRAKLPGGQRRVVSAVTLPVRGTYGYRGRGERRG
jgi:hypothetical protein